MTLGMTDKSTMLNRRELLRRGNAGNWFPGVVSFADERGSGKRTAPSTASEERDLPAYGRRTIADGHVRSKSRNSTSGTEKVFRKK